MMEFDGSEIRPLHQLRLVVEIYQYLQGFSTIPGGCYRFLNHQQYNGALIVLEGFIEFWVSCFEKFDFKTSAKPTDVEID